MTTEARCHMADFKEEGNYEPRNARKTALKGRKVKKTVSPLGPAERSMALLTP